MISGIEKKIQVDQAIQSLILPVLYFDIFSFPLTLEEVLRYRSGKALAEPECRALLDQLVSLKILFFHRGYYSLEDRPEWVDQRVKNQERAQPFLAKAKSMSRLIAQFPFVRAVFVSGSLSKDILPPDGDIDYFIVTGKGGLWIARTLLILYKKIFLLNSHRYFCLNYFVDEDHLNIDEHNIYTATELVTLLPLYGRDYYESISHANPWVKSYFPNSPVRNVDGVPVYQNRSLTKIIEWLLNGTTGKRLNRFLMALTVGYWRRKFRRLDREAFERSFQSTPYLSRHHPVDFQPKVIHAFRERIRKFEKNHGLNLHAES